MIVAAGMTLVRNSAGARDCRKRYLLQTDSCSCYRLQIPIDALQNQPSKPTSKGAQETLQSTPTHYLHSHLGSVPVSVDLHRGWILTVRAVPVIVAVETASFVLWLPAADSDLCTPKSAQ